MHIEAHHVVSVKSLGTALVRGLCVENKSDLKKIYSSDTSRMHVKHMPFFNMDPRDPKPTVRVVVQIFCDSLIGRPGSG